MPTPLDAPKTPVRQVAALCRRDRLQVLLCGVALLTAGCASTRVGVRFDCSAADARLAAIWSPLTSGSVGSQGCQSVSTLGVPPSCGDLARDLQQLAFVCPAHAPTLLANAVLAYQDRRVTAAQQFLDNLAEFNPDYPEAVILRARIALEQGNLPFARRVLADEIRLRPDHGALREVYAGVLYLAGDLPGARINLDVAENLGAPAWRLAYHRGLIAESSSSVLEAERYYQLALDARPKWEQAERRLAGLRARKAPGSDVR